MMVKTRDVVNIAVACVLSFSLILHTIFTLRQSADFFNSTNPEELKLNTAASTAASTTTASTVRALPETCMEMDELEQAIANADQTFLVATAKAGGTSLQGFAFRCVGQEYKNIVNNGDPRTEILTKYEKPPKVIASHVQNDYGLIKLINSIDRSALVIFIYRNELDRLKSAMSYAAMTRVCNSIPIVKEYFGKQMERIPNAIQKTDGKCIIDEELMLDIIENKFVEIGEGQHRVLSCKTYDSIKNNDPNLLFVHYTQSDQVQSLIAKYHCPERVGKPRHTNAFGDKGEEPFIHSRTLNKTLPVREWTQNKGSVVQWALDLYHDEKVTQCHGNANAIERDMNSCPSKAVRSPKFL